MLVAPLKRTLVIWLIEDSGTLALHMVHPRSREAAVRVDRDLVPVFVGGKGTESSQ